MPSPLHEALLELFRNRPQLAPELLQQALHVEVPPYSEVRIESVDLSELQPAEYRADLVILLYRGEAVLGIVVEAQLEVDPRKLFSWPHYATGVRARFRCPVYVLVVAVEERVARWAAQAMELGGGNVYRVQVLGPDGVPVVTDPQAARAAPELAVLSAMAHGAERDTERAVQIALAALAGSIALDDARAKLYGDLVYLALSEAARKALQSMDPAKYEYQSEFARHYVAEGLAQGRVEGKVELVMKLLVRRFGPLPEEAEQRVRAASVEELDSFAERVLTAQSLEQVLAPL